MADPKSTMARLPGVLETHRIIKNLQHRLWPSLATRGGIERGGMSVSEAVAYTGSIFGKIDARVEDRGGWAGKRVLELGPGDSLGTGLRCLAAGAESYCAIDRFAVAIDAVFEKEVFAEIGSDLSGDARIRVAQYLPGRAFLGETFKYFNDLPVESSPAILGEGGYDVVFSNAVLEHVADVRGTLRACRDLLADDGFMYHEVDLRSHQNYEQDPLRFLAYPEWLWRLMSSHNGEPNRDRLPHYRDYTRQLGLRIVECNVKDRFDSADLDVARGRLAARFASLGDEDLAPAVFEMVCERE